MKSTIVALALAAGSNALAIRNVDTCCFELTASGAVKGTAGQLKDGQVRINGPLSAASFCISQGGITDSAGRGCILTPPTSQFQCDSGASPTLGFSIGADNVVAYNGQTVFYECQTGDNGEANVYLTPGGTNCGQITLTASGCGTVTTPPPPNSCPTTLSGSYEYPHLIIPVDSSQPDTAPGTSYNGVVSSTVSSIFNFDIPSSDSGKTCSLVFLFPEQSQLQTSSYTFSGNGGIDFSMLSGVATQGTTYNNAPGVATDYGVTTVAPGNSYSIATFACPAGQTVSYELKASGDTSLTYFQDYNPSPIGLYITTC